MSLPNNTNYKYSNNYACRNDHHDDRTWTGGHFMDALEKSGKETFTKEDLIPIHANVIANFCADFRDKKKEEEQKSKEAELSKLGILPKSGIS